jgi:hypothetical protein
VRFVAETTAILDQIEALSGRPVRFMEERDLTVLSAMQVARDGASFHVLRYRPSDEPLDYRVAFQAAYTLRLFQCPESVRADSNVSHRADRNLSQGWEPTLRSSAVDKCRSLAVSLTSSLLV